MHTTRLLCLLTMILVIAILQLAHRRGGLEWWAGRRLQWRRHYRAFYKAKHPDNETRRENILNAFDSLDAA